MKKVSIFVVSLMLLILTGCSDKTEVLRCSGKTAGDNMNAASKVEYVFKNKKLSTSKIDVTFQDITVENLDTFWETFKTQFTEQNKPVEVEGYKRSVSADDENHTFTVTIEIDHNAISDETMKKYSIENYNDKTYDEIKKITLEEDNWTCE